MQLVTDQVKVLYRKAASSASRCFTNRRRHREVRRETGADTDLKALKGTHRTIFRGVPGIGDKTAALLLQKFDSIEDIYDRIGEVSPPKLQEKLRENESAARRSKELATIVTDAPVTLKPEECKIFNFDRSKVAALFRELEFFSLLNKLPESAPGLKHRRPLRRNRSHYPPPAGRYLPPGMNCPGTRRRLQVGKSAVFRY